MTEQETRAALTALGQQAQRLRESIEAGRVYSDEARQETAAGLEEVAALAEERGEEMMGILCRLLRTMLEDIGRLEQKIRALEDEAGIGLDKQ